MAQEILIYLVDIIFLIFGIILILRAWMFAIRLHPFNPFSQAILKASDWLIMPIRKVIPVSGRFDWPSIICCWLTAMIYLLLVSTLATGGIFPPWSFFGPLLLGGLFTALKWVFNLIVWVTLIQAVLSWINPLSPIMPVLYTLTAPLLDPIRKIMPRTGGIDFSPLVLLIIAQIAMMVLNHMAFSSIAGV